ncbi:oxysterol-binding protein 2 isoform X2 [Antechinus flavipes]|uniref:oxysterol-binding protein 2 isoform X2 n=1 Tax=Antechinus flavipes TaxID=38775 RepID=UPI002236725A|nr:oxysterol-binding protein 2 isoform X2 [Antechinus flavipes]
MSALPPLASTLPPPPETPEEEAGAAALADKHSGAEDSPGSSPDILKGWLFKWTNYLKGYQRRWFVLSNGLLSYYRNQGEMAYNCRATINLSTAHFDREDSCNIWLSYGGRTYHLKAGSEVERQQWLGALELARAKAVRMMSTLSARQQNGLRAEIRGGSSGLAAAAERASDSHRAAPKPEPAPIQEPLPDDSGDEEVPNHSDKSDLQNTLSILSGKLDDLSICNDLISKHGAALQRSLNELESLKIPVESGEKLKAVSERATLFRITSNAMINACRDFLEIAEIHSRKWQRALQYEQEQRVRLEETIEQLARQHNSLERACRGAPANPQSENLTQGPGDTKKDTSPAPVLGGLSGWWRRRAHTRHRRIFGKASCRRAGATGEISDEDEDTEYFDAMEDSSFITVITDPKENRSAEGGNEESPVDEWNAEDHVFGNVSRKGGIPPKVKRRTRIPDKPNYNVNLWSIMKNCIGKELSKIPMPVNFNEPLSMLQRLTEDLEYHELLDKAVKCENSTEQMCFVAAFSVSSYSTTVNRIAKPFNPMLGETYELDQMEEMGFRSLCEQVSHHPPAAAHHVFSKNGWTLWQEITISSKFRGKYLSIMPLGDIHLEFHASGNHYIWRKSTSTVHNIIVGKLWIDQTGDIEIINHKTKDKCLLKFTPYSYFSKDYTRKVTGVVTDSKEKAHYVLSGSWDEKMECAKIIQSSHSSPSTEGKQKMVYQTLPAKILWKKYPLPENAENMYYFSELALILNEPEEGVAPTDSRWRPDQRLMENGQWDEANAEKQRLEEKQRMIRRKRLESSGQETLEEGKDELYKPLWFEKKLDPFTGVEAYVYKGGYWEAKEQQNWAMCPDIF